MVISILPARGSILAAALINARLTAIGDDDLTQAIKKAQYYYENKPYPTYQPETFKETPKACAPIPKFIVNKSAVFLFGRQPYFYVKGLPEATEYVRRVLVTNRIPSQLVGMAEKGGVEGAVVLKFTYDGTDLVRPWRISQLSPAHCRFIYNPDDWEELILVRVQYARVMPDKLTASWYREEWTAEEIITYYDVESGDVDETGDDWKREPRKYEEPGETPRAGPWKIRARSPNLFGLIPFVQVRNLSTPTNPTGQGDFWDLFDLFDRINLTLDKMDVQNQQAADPPAKFINTAEGVPRSVAPGAVYSLWGQGADASYLEPRGYLRAAMADYITWLESMCYDTSGVVRVDMKNVSGLGQMSAYALELLHQPLVELTNRKRATYGADGICLFFEKLFLAAARMGVLPDRGPIDVECKWGQYFNYSPLDRQVELGNIKLALETGTISAYDAGMRAADLWDVPESEREEFIQRVNADVELNQQLREVLGMAKASPAPQPGGNTQRTQQTSGGEKNSSRVATGGK